MVYLNVKFSHLTTRGGEVKFKNVGFPANHRPQNPMDKWPSQIPALWQNLFSYKNAHQLN